MYRLRADSLFHRLDRFPPARPVAAATCSNDHPLATPSLTCSPRQVTRATFGRRADCGPRLPPDLKGRKISIDPVPGTAIPLLQGRPLVAENPVPEPPAASSD
jgi:hypothetical protein